MVERRPLLDAPAHATLWLAVAALGLPIWIALVTSTQAPGDVIAAPVPMWFGARGPENYAAVLASGLRASSSGPVGPMLVNSFLMASAIALGRIAISFLSAFAVVCFRFPFRNAAFGLVLLTLMLPVEVRILPTYEVVAGLGLLGSFAGLTVPLMASATATFLLRQFFLTVPPELAEAARVDGAGPLRFLRDILLPLSRTNLAALFVILFVYGWNQYLWPLLVTTDPARETIVVAIKKMVEAGDTEPEWPRLAAVTVLALLPPVAVVLLLQRWFVRGLVETEK